MNSAHTPRHTPEQTATEEALREPGAEREPQPDPTPYVDVRLQAVERTRRMGVQLAFHCWEQRFLDPLAPHCVAFLFVEQDRRRPGFWRLSAAWKLWLDTPEVRDLAHMLFELQQRLAPRAAGTGFDIRELADGRDPEMGDGTGVIYAGLTVLSLDIGTATWESVKATARTALDIPAVIRIVLTDGTVMVCHQQGRSNFSRFFVESTRPLVHGTARALFDWRRVSAEALCGDDGHRDILRWANELSDTVAQADNGRIVATRHTNPDQDQRTSTRRGNRR